MKKIALLGATGSIGEQTIDVIKNNPEDFKLVAISVGKNIKRLNEILKQFDTIEIVCVQNKEDVSKVDFPKVVYGQDGLNEIALADVDILLTAVVGSVGLVPTINAIKNKTNIALANKETLVTAGHIIMPLVKEYGVNLYPVDSEHSAIFQCLNGENPKEVNKLILTASGGSFRDKTLQELKNVTKKEALAHPNWSMGNKITIDSATLVNKGLEVIEAHWLFNIDYDDIEVVIHKQSIIHSMVEFIDYSVIAQLSIPDMRLPIQYALTYPQRKEIVGFNRLNFKDIKNLEFQEVDFERFEGLKLAYEVGKKGNSYPTVYNAANEAAVDLFLNDKIKFYEITNIIKEEIKNHKEVIKPTLEQILNIDQEIKKRLKEEY